METMPLVSVNQYKGPSCIEFSFGRMPLRTPLLVGAVSLIEKLVIITEVKRLICNYLLNGRQ